MNAQQIDWSDLHLVLAVCREGTLSGAARLLGVNHSTVFRRVGAIEDRLGVRLFERLPTGYIMTEAGEAMLKTGERVENEILALSRDLVGRDLNLHGLLRVAVPDALLLQCILPMLDDFTRRFPDIQLELAVSNHYLNLSRREADVAVRVTDTPPESAIGRHICSMASTLYATREYIQRHDNNPAATGSWLMPDEELAHLPINLWQAKHYPQARIGLRCNSLLGLHQAARQSLGVVALPCFLADPDDRLCRLVPPPTELASELWLLTHPDLRRTARVKAFMDFLAEILTAQQDLIQGDSIA